MANKDSAKKMIRKIKVRTLRNRFHKSKTMTFRRNAENSILNVLKVKTEESIEIAKNAFNVAQKQMQKAVTKGVYHKNKAARLISRLHAKLKKATNI